MLTPAILIGENTVQNKFTLGSQNYFNWSVVVVGPTFNH